MPAAESVAGLVAAAGGAGIGKSGEMFGFRLQRSLFVAAGTCGAFGALLAHSRATGWGAADAGWRILLAVAITITATRAKDAPLLVAGAAVAIAAPSSAAWLGFAAIAVVVAGTTPAARAAAGALIGNGLLRASWPNGHGRTAVLTAVVVIAMVLATDRRFIKRAALAACAVFAVCAIVVGAAGPSLSAQRHVAIQAVDAGQRGLDAAREGRSTEAQQHFARAAELLAGVDTTLGRWTTKPALAVPVVGVNLHELREVVDIAHGIAVTGVTTARAADVDRIAPRDGAVDLVALRSFSKPLADLDVTLSRARRRLAALGSPWTVSGLSRRTTDLRRRATRAQADAQRARRAVDTVPRLLGGEGRRRYFLAVMTPSELRGGGGFVGNWGILEAENGRLSLPRFGRINELYRDEPYRISVDPEYDDRYVRGWQLDTYPQNILASPDLPSNALAIRQILEQAGEGAIDGLVVVDPIAMAALLKLTGPIDVAGWPEPLGSGNVAEILLYKQYENAGDPKRPELLARTTKALFSRITTGVLPSIGSMAGVLGPVVGAGDLQFASLHERDVALLADLGLDHRLTSPSGDVLGVVSQNAAPSKLDWFLRRSVTYDLTVAPTGRASGTVTISMENTAPARGLPDTYFQYTFGGLAPGVNVQATSIYTALHVSQVTLDGSAVEFGQSVERGHRVYDRFVTLPPGGRSSLAFHLDGPVPLANGRYRLQLRRQPVAHHDQVRVIVNGRVLFDGPLQRNEDLSSEVR